MSKLKQLLFSLNEPDRRVIEEKLKEKDQQIDQLKQQLDEKDKMRLLDEKEFQNYCAYKWIEPEIKGCLDREREYKQQLAEKDKEINSLIIDYEKRISQEQELMSNMEHRLTEKQNTIDEINKEFVQSVKDWKALCAEKDKEILGLQKKLGE